MRTLYAHGWLALVVLLGAACAQTTEEPSDGQTHWMTRCEADGDCGELECICGMCTLRCVAGDACAVEESEGACVAASSVPDADACSGASADEVRICAPSEPTVPRDPIALDCGETLEESDQFEIVYSDRQLDTLAAESKLKAFTVTEDETLFVATYEDDGDGDTVDLGSLYRIRDDGAFEKLSSIDVDVLEPAGADLLVAAHNLNRDTTIIARIDSKTGELVVLNSEPPSEPLGPYGYSRWPSSIAFDDRWVYWAAQVGRDGLDDTGPTSQIWRTPHEPGQAEMLVELDPNLVKNALKRVGSSLIFARNSDEGAQLLGLELGTSVPETLLAPVASGATTRIRSVDYDGAEVLLSMYEVRNDSAEGLRFTSLDLSSGTMTTLLAPHSGNDLTWRGDYLFWIAAGETDADSDVLFRGMKSKDGAVETIGTAHSAAVSGPPIVVTSSNIYWAVTCHPSYDTKYIVKIAFDN